MWGQRNIVTLAVPNTIARSIHYPNVYEITFSRNKVKKAISKLCFWILEKLGCANLFVGKEEICNAKEITIDLNDMGETIYKCRNELMQYYGTGVKTLLVGKDEYCMFLDQEKILRSTMNYDYMHDGRPNPKLQGVDIVLVPWLEGAIPLSVRVMEEPDSYMTGHWEGY